jgi:hypothetical protein
MRHVCDDASPRDVHVILYSVIDLGNCLPEFSVSRLCHCLSERCRCAFWLEQLLHKMTSVPFLWFRCETGSVRPRCKLRVHGPKCTSYCIRWTLEGPNWTLEDLKLTLQDRPFGAINACRAQPSKVKQRNGTHRNVKHVAGRMCYICVLVCVK